MENKSNISIKASGGFQMSKGIYYNYDLDECNWLFKYGIRPIGCGKHDKTGNTFIIFQINKQYKELDQKYKEQTINPK